MSNPFENNNYSPNSLETKDDSSEIPSLLKKLEDRETELVKTENTGLQNLCNKYPQLPAKASQVPKVNQLTEECDDKIAKNDKNHDEIVKYGVLQLSALEETVGGTEGTQVNSGTDEVKLSTADYLTNHKAVAQNNTDVQETSAQGDDQKMFG